MSKISLDCVYCGASNPAGTNRCRACGAPIEPPVTPPVRVTYVNTPPVMGSVKRPDTSPEQIRDALDAAPIDSQIKDTLKQAGAGIAGLGVGTLIARTAAEAGAIAFSSFLIAFFAAKTHSLLLGLAGGLIIGLMVGLVVKRPLAVLFSAPLGTIAGLVGGRFLQPSLPNWPVTLLLAIAGGALLGVLGGRRGTTSGPAKWYTRFRPLLGMIGGFTFALIGYAIGAIFR